jgi:CHAT domain-containing protein/tetratricopeptide (TPR) repeat protein
MRFPDQHLSADEIELLAGEGDRSDDSRSGLNEAREHVEVCEQCRQILSAQQDLAATMELLRNPGGARKQADCPPLDIWLQLAGGTLAANENDAYLDHAAQCDYCGSVLAEVSRDFDKPVNVNEKIYLDQMAQLSIPSPEMKTKAPRSDGDEKLQHPRQSWSHRNLGWLASLAAVLVALMVGVFSYRYYEGSHQYNEAEHVRSLLAQSFTERRNIELRFPDAAYAEWQGRRGAQNTKDNPPELDEANSKIKIAVRKHPEDSTWLQLKGRAALLVWDDQSAIESFNDAIALKPNDPSLLIDKATALYERAEHQGAEKGDLSAAANTLEIALTLAPRNPVALFNLALIYEKIGSPHVAIDHWQQYLSIESSGPWAAEALEHLKSLREHTLDHDQQSMKPLVSALTVSSADRAEILADLDARIEQYQQAALLEWIPASFADQNAHEIINSPYLVATNKLATVLDVEHEDPWMKDLLAFRSSGKFVSGIEALRKAIKEKEKGQPEKAFKDSIQAVVLFRQSHNKAAILRAEIEQIHALQRMQRGGECLVRSKIIGPLMTRTRYQWLRIQLGIDRAVCALEVGQFDLARSFIAPAIEESLRAKYPSLHMRSIGIAASIATAEGDVVSSWTTNLNGITEYWRTKNADPMRAHQFYDDLSYVAEDLQQFYVAAAIAEENVRVTALTQDISSQALSLQRLAKLDFQIGNRERAAIELTKSRDLLAKLDDNDGARLDGEISLVRIELDEGQGGKAESQLTSIQKRMAGLSSLPISMNFSLAMSRALMNNHNLIGAEAILRDAIYLVDNDLQHISQSSDRQIWNEEVGFLYRSLIQLEIDKKEPERAFALWQWYLSSPIRQYSRQVNEFFPFSTTFRPENLYLKAGNEALLSYSELPGGMTIWVVTSHGIALRTVSVDATKLHLQVEQFAHLCADERSNLDFLELQARALYRIMITPIKDLLPANVSLVVQLDDNLSSLPFHALLGEDGRFLIEHFAISFAPIRFQPAGEAPMKIDPSKLDAIIVGSMARLPNQQPIPGIKEEADMVTSIFPHHIEIVEDKATAKSLTKLLLTAQLLHYVGHGGADEENDGLVMRTSSLDSRSTVWGAADIPTGLSKKCRLVVLAACSTLQQHFNWRARRSSLVISLLMHGVPDIVATKWDVDARYSRILMYAFYHSLNSAGIVSFALAQACRQLIATAKTHHPYYWAAFVNIRRR